MDQRDRLSKMPGEILLKIFNQTETPTDPRTDGHGRHPESIRTIQNLRLTCRRFNHLASLLLVPVLRVDHRFSSVDRFERVVSHPLIGPGVRVVQISLYSFSRQLAHDFKEFKGHMKSQLSGLLGSRWQYGEYLLISKRDDTIGPDLQRARNLMAAMMANDGLYKPVHQDMKKELDQDRRDMNEAYKRYRLLFLGQERLRQPGNGGGPSLFATRIAKAMANISGERTRCLEFVDGYAHRPYEGLFGPGTDWSRSNYSLFYAPLLTPSFSESLPREIGEDPPMSYTLVQVPQALHAAGVGNIDAMAIKLPYMPLQITDDSTQKLSDALASLRLKSFTLDCNTYWGLGQNTYLRAERYMETCLAQPALRQISLQAPNSSMYQFGPDDNNEIILGPLSRCISQVTYRGNTAGYATTSTYRKTHINDNLTRVNLSGASFLPESLATFLDTLPPVMDEFRLWNIRLLFDESPFETDPPSLKESEIDTTFSRILYFEDMLDTFRQRLIVRHPMNFHLGNVFIGVHDLAPLSSNDLQGIFSHGDDRNPRMSLAEEYITRLSDVNPIWALRSQREG